MATSWQETYAGGSAEAERREFDRLSIDIMRAQLRAKKASGSANVDRAFHAKAVLAVEDAELLFRDDLPDELTVGFAKPGSHYRATCSDLERGKLRAAGLRARSARTLPCVYTSPMTSSTTFWRRIILFRTRATRANS